MSSARILLRHPAVAAALLLWALLARVLVPAGYMPAVVGGAVRLELCSGSMSAVPMAGMHHGGGRHDAPAKAEQPCAFAVLVAPALGSADPVLPAIALVFALAAALHWAALRLPRPSARLRPPLRAPPVPA